MLQLQQLHRAIATLELLRLLELGRNLRRTFGFEGVMRVRCSTGLTVGEYLMGPPRPGALELLKRLEILKVPVLIVSAGLSDVIEEFLRQHGALTENVVICSNRINYGADTAPQSVAPDPPLTSFTKATAYNASASFFREHSKRTNLSVMGDSCTDVDPAVHVPFPAAAALPSYLREGGETPAERYRRLSAECM